MSPGDTRYTNHNVMETGVAGSEHAATTHMTRTERKKQDDTAHNKHTTRKHHMTDRTK